MSEAETTNVEARKKRDNSRLRKIAIRHAAFALRHLRYGEHQTLGLLKVGFFWPRW